MSSLLRASCLAALVAALLLAGCGGSRPGAVSPSTPDVPVQVVVLADLPPGDLLVLQSLAAKFEGAKHGGVRILLRSPSDYLTGTSATSSSEAAASPVTPVADAVAVAVGAEEGDGAAGGSGVAQAAETAQMPQVAIVGPAGLAKLATTHRIEPPSGDLAKSLAKSLLPAALRAVGGDAPLGVPLDLDVDVLYVRRGLLYQPPVAWSDILGVAKQSTAGGREAGPIAIGALDPDPIVALVTLAQAFVGNMPGQSAQNANATPVAAADASALSGANGTAAAGQLSAWVKAGDLRIVAHPLASFISGAVGLAVAPASSLGDLEAALAGHDRFLVSTLPALPATPRVAVQLLYGSKAARDAAADFAEFLAQPRMDAFWAIQTGRLPAESDAYDEDAWAAYAVNHPEVAVMANAVAHSPAWDPLAFADARAAALADMPGGHGDASQGNR